MQTSYITRINWSKMGLWQSRRPLLNRLSIELTERCNFDCIHCYINQPADDRELQAREMTTDQIREILREAAQLGALTVHLSGGEPLLRPDFSEIYLYARKLGMRVLLFTNGSLITPEIADLFAKVPPLREIEISVYGMSPQSYEAVTQVRGAHGAVEKGIRRLLERKVSFVIKGAFLPPNIHEIGAFEAWAAKLSAMKAEPNLSILLNLRGRRDSEEKNSRIAALRLSPEVGVRAIMRNSARYRREMVEFCSKFLRPQGNRLFVCNFRNGVSVDAYGRLQPCLLLRHPELVHDLLSANSVTPLKDALEISIPRLRDMQSQNPEYLRRCARCFLMGLCRQCPAKSWMEHGTLDDPAEYLCTIAHSEARGLGLLGEGEHGWEITDWQERIQRLQAPLGKEVREAKP